MKKIILMLYDIELAEITDRNGIFVSDNEEAILKAKELYPLNMRAYKKGLSNYVYPLETYFNAFNRRDIVDEAKINDSDSAFIKLYKVAGLDMEPINGFYLTRE